jgi:hypothetical protein
LRQYPWLNPSRPGARSNLARPRSDAADEHGDESREAGLEVGGAQRDPALRAGRRAARDPRLAQEAQVVRARRRRQPDALADLAARALALLVEQAHDRQAQRIAGRAQHGREVELGRRRMADLAG